MLLARSVLALLLVSAIPAAAGDLSAERERLGSEDPLVRYEAARALGDAGPAAREAVPALIALLGDQRGFVRDEAGRALVRIGVKKRDLEPLLARLDATDPDVARWVAAALATAGRDAAAPLVERLEADEPRVRRHAIAALEQLGRHGAEAVPRLVDLAFDDDAATREAAGRALRRLGPWAAEYVPELVDRLQLGPDPVRWLAARLLGRLGPAAREAAPALRELLRSDKPRTRDAAADALKRIDIPPRRPPHPALRDPALAREKAPPEFRVRFETTRGDFVVLFKRAWAPLGVDRVFNLVRIGFFDDAAFFRVLRGRVAQFGLNGDSRVNGAWSGATLPDDPRVLSNKRGTIAFAKRAAPKSRSTQLFLNLADNTGLDAGGFAPVGRIVEGIEVADALYAGYGDGPPGGQGPDQRAIASMGNEYLRRRFPRLDYIKRTALLEE